MIIISLLTSPFLLWHFFLFSCSSGCYMDAICTTCIQCSPGTYTTVNNAWSGCLSCGVNQYQPNYNSNFCYDCPSGKYSNGGASSCLSYPTKYPTRFPTRRPTQFPTTRPTRFPTFAPSAIPTSPTPLPTRHPTPAPSVIPTSPPSFVPSATRVWFLRAERLAPHKLIKTCICLPCNP